MAMPASCALDVADAGPHSLQAIGDALGMTRERVRQIEAAALLSLQDVFTTGWNLKEVDNARGETCKRS